MIKDRLKELEKEIEDFKEKRWKVEKLRQIDELRKFPTKKFEFEDEVKFKERIDNIYFEINLKRAKIQAYKEALAEQQEKVKRLKEYFSNTPSLKRFEKIILNIVDKNFSFEADKGDGK